MKYKSLERHGTKMSDRDHEEDEMKVVYHEDMQAGNTCKTICTLRKTDHEEDRNL